MGEIFHALEVLNRSMKLGLSGKDLLRAEMGFKSALAMQGNPDPTAVALRGDPIALAEQFETVTVLRKRAKTMSLNELSTLAGKAMTQPKTRVDAATFKKIDKAFAAPLVATTVKPPKGVVLNPKTGVIIKGGKTTAKAKAKPKKA